MADDEIIIPVKVTTDDAKSKFDELGSDGAKAFGQISESAKAAAESIERAIAAASKRVNITPDEFKQRGQEFAARGGGGGGSEEGGGEGGKPPKPPSNKQHYINVEQQVFSESGEEASESTAGIRLFREALHALHPALSEAGIGVGELSALVSAARGGIVALAAAIGGLLLTSLERASDQANDSASKLGAFSGGIAGGKQQYEALSGVADKLQTPTSGLVAPFEQASRLNQSQASQAQLPNSGVLEAISNVVKGGQSERVDTAKMMEEFTKFLSNGREKGIFGPDDFKVLEEIAPRTAAAIEAQLPKGQSNFTGGQVLGAVRNAGPQIDANSVDALALPDSIPAAWDKVKASYEHLAEATSGGHALASTLDAFASFMGGVASKLDAINRINIPRDSKQLEDQHTRDLPDVGEAPASAALEFLRNSQNNLASNDPSEAQDYARKLSQNQSPLVQATDQTAKQEPESAVSVAADKVTKSLENLGNATDNLQKQMDEFHLTPKDAIDVKSADLGFKQASIDKKYEPEESASKLSHDEISVQNADLHLKQAKLSASEAQKNVALSRYVPEEAYEHRQDAESRRDSALSKFYKNRGVNTSQLDAVNAAGADLRELNAAETALKKARVEEKYSHLEEPKAELAAQQSETAIKSASLEKHDASLRFSKDKESAPVSHELQQLKYSEANLKQQEVHTKYDEQKVQLLAAILQKIGGSKLSPEGTTQGDGNTISSQPSSQPVERNQDVTPDGYERTFDGLTLKSAPPKQPSTEQQPPTEQQPLSTEQPTTPVAEKDQSTSVQTNGLQDALQQLTGSVKDASENIKQDEPTKDDAQGHAAGGHIQGPGTSTSDSIPAMLSDGEFVMKAEAVSRVGVDTMHAVNNGVAHFADGGSVDENDDGTNYIDPITGKKKKRKQHKSQFVGPFGGSIFGGQVEAASGGLISLGGLIGSGSLRVPHVFQHFNAGGLATRIAQSIPPVGFASGGSAHSAPAAAASEMSHWGTIDLRHDRGNFKVATERDTMRHLSSVSQKARRYSTGNKPRWYGGGQ